MRKVTDNVAKMQEIWLSAAEEDITIPCKDKASALLIRFKLYNAVKGVRKNPEINPELAAALEIVQISLRGELENEVWIGKSAASTALEATFTRLGITGQRVKVRDEVDLAAEESLKRLTGLVEAGGVEGPQTTVGSHGYPLKNGG